MNRIRRITVALTALATAMLAFTAASPAAFAIRVPPPGGMGSGITRSVPWPTTATVPPLPQVHTVVTGGTPGWQIALIAAGAALLAAVLAVSLDRARAARRQVSAPSA
jgi:hypothetical protein